MYYVLAHTTESQGEVHRDEDQLEAYLWYQAL